jgi:hypothetical protein
VLTSVRRHRLDLREAALRAGKRGFRDHIGSVAAVFRETLLGGFDETIGETP